MGQTPSLRQAALAALALPDPAGKAAGTRALWSALEAGALQIDPAETPAAPPGLPGRPALPRLVPAKQVPTRSPATLAGRAALLHAICHIEFNAIKIALYIGKISGWHRHTATSVGPRTSKRQVTRFEGRPLPRKRTASSTD